MTKLASTLLLLLTAGPAAAQVISSAADNDMDPNFAADGWANSVGTYDVVVEPTGFIGHAWLEPPDGNTYGGGVQYGGVPGVSETIQKTIDGLTAGTAYAVEWYIMSDRVQGAATEDVWFDVSFCGTTVETLHIPFSRAREWIQEVRVFTANATSCALSFAARNPTGNNANWIFLDSVQVAVATRTDFAIIASGPALLSTALSTHTIGIGVTSNGPDRGTPPVVTYPLPAGASVALGAVPVAGADAAAWSCIATGATTITCTRNAPMAVGSTSAFSIEVDFGPLAGGTMLASMISVSPTFQQGNIDPNPRNNIAMFPSRVPRCGDSAVEGFETCDDGNAAAGDGCSDVCLVEPGFTCMTAGTTCEPICGDALVRAREQCDDGGLVAGDGCAGDCTVETGWICPGEPSVCEAAECGDGLVRGTEDCDDRNAVAGDGCSQTCAFEPGWTCGGEPSVCIEGICGDGRVASVEGCDDGGTASGDGCSSACVVEMGWSCTGAPSSCMTACGDGLIVGGEACDDGDADGGDGCSSACAVETGWACTGAPSICEPTVCGDGVLIASEACDDGNVRDGDGCSSACEVEHGFMCMPACASTCGDGVVASDEDCDDGNVALGDGCDASCAAEPGFSCDGEPSACTAGCAEGFVRDPMSGECVTYTITGSGCATGGRSSSSALVWALLVLGLVGVRATRRRRG